MWSTAQFRFWLGVFAGLTVLGWVLLILSFWVFESDVHQAFQSTAMALLFPGGVGVVGLVIFEEELKRPHPMRCTTCGTQILDTSGTTVSELKSKRRDS